MYIEKMNDRVTKVALRSMVMATVLTALFIWSDYNIWVGQLIGLIISVSVIWPITQMAHHDTAQRTAFAVVALAVPALLGLMLYYVIWRNSPLGYSFVLEAFALSIYWALSYAH